MHISERTLQAEEIKVKKTFFVASGTMVKYVVSASTRMKNISTT